MQAHRAIETMNEQQKIVIPQANIKDEVYQCQEFTKLSSTISTVLLEESQLTTWTNPLVADGLGTKM